MLAHGDANVGEYEAAVFTCHACKELEKEKVEGPGKKKYVRDLHDDPPEEEPDEEDQASE